MRSDAESVAVEEAGEIFIPKSDRLANPYSSANHDEWHDPEPELFEIEPDAQDHVAFGYNFTPISLRSSEGA